MERWKDVKGYEGIYQVSVQGVVKSLDRTVYKQGSPKRLKGKYLQQGLTISGYPIVSLCKNGKSTTTRVHKLVAIAFLKEIKNGQVVHHRDHDKLNNNIGNLEITSRQKNTQEYYKTLGKSTGLVPISDICLIQQRVNNGEKCYIIAKEYNVSRNDIAVLCKIVSLTGEELTTN